MTKFKFCALCSGKLALKNHNKETPCYYRNNDKPKRLTCLNCGFVFFQNPVPTVLAIIEKNSKILLVKRAINPYKGFWDIPGGFVEIGESLEKALKKEIKEELGVEVKAFKYLGSFPSQYKIKFMHEDLVGVVFKVKLALGKLKPGSDASQAKWFDKKSLPKLVPHKDINLAFKKFML